MRAEGPKRTGEDVGEESRLKKTMKYLKKLYDADANAEITEVEVNEEDLDMEAAVEMQDEEGDQELDRVQVQQGRREEFEHMIKTLQSSS